MFFEGGDKKAKDTFVMVISLIPAAQYFANSVVELL